MTVFRSKVLEAHYSNTYGVDTDSRSSASDEDTTTGLPDSKKSESPPVLEFPGELEGSMQQARSILKAHKTFLHKQEVLVKGHCEKMAGLPRVVSSRGRSAEDVAHTTGDSSGQRRVSQADKNRKRKLKKRRSKVKHQKLEQVKDEVAAYASTADGNPQSHSRGNPQQMVTHSRGQNFNC